MTAGAVVGWDVVEIREWIALADCFYFLERLETTCTQKRLKLERRYLVSLISLGSLLFYPLLVHTEWLKLLKIDSTVVSIKAWVGLSDNSPQYSKTSPVIFVAS
jgi:hypothetical protein